MSLASTMEDEKRRRETLEQRPGVQIFLQPIAPPAALGLAGFAGSTFITASYIANWWGNAQSPTIFFPFVGIFGGLAQFIAGLYGFRARDTLVTVINTMWGSFWIAIGILYAFVAAKALEPHEVHTHFPELASWFVVLCVLTWSCTLAATARDLVLTACLFSLATGSTIACCLFAYNGGTGSASGDGLHGGVTRGIKAAAYFWMFSALMAWWRVTVFLVEEAYGPDHAITKFFPIGRTPLEKRVPYVIPGLGEPGVKRGVPKPLAV
ncbi:GPR1/FUN34/yaaH family-domain-containing protein [Apiospora rasikravindrae]|uniref:GPR1/FUN34/yaaH family-domain-containing protein n=1 Tax=Apiospora rasikravindrae TaxID=990691 RepID=A0ABR1TAG4_9PEZI